jgi:hypothetical protein
VTLASTILRGESTFDVIVIAALIVAATVVWATQQILHELRSARAEAARGRTTALLQMFAPALAAADADPRALLVWHPLAQHARTIFPDEFASLDRAAASAFPFTKERLQAAHAKWTTDWLAWERAHDAEYKVKAAMAEQDLVASGGSPVQRARLDAVEREKLDLYQRRYTEYVQVAKALQALTV